MRAAATSSLHGRPRSERIFYSGTSAEILPTLPDDVRVRIAEAILKEIGKDKGGESGLTEADKLMLTKAASEVTTVIEGSHGPTSGYTPLAG